MKFQLEFHRIARESGENRAKVYVDKEPSEIARKF